MPKLTELEASLIRVDDRQDGRFFVPVETVAEAQGVKFLCPKCFSANGGPAGTHSVICWSATSGAPSDVRPLPGRWRLIGSSIEDLTLEAEPGKTRSVLILGGCEWHGFVTSGVAE